MPERTSEVAVVRYRGKFVENRHAASVAVAAPDGRLIGWWGDPERMTWLRSANKPFQALMMVETGAADRFGLTEEEIALCCSSHNGEAGHVEGVLSILGKLGLDPSVLRCGAHPPMEQATMFRVGAGYSRLHSDCSGKHSGMLALARHLGVEPADYLDPKSRSQRLIRRAVADMVGLRLSGVKVAIDGCGAPTFAVPLRNAALAYARLAAGVNAGRHREALLRIRDAMRAHPWMVGGSHRFDSEFMRDFPGMVAKSGAEAFQGIGVPDPAVGIALKIEDGTYAVKGLVIFETLKQLGLVNEADRTRLAARDYSADRSIYNWDHNITGHSVVPLKLRWLPPGLQPASATA
jgi:L-asparaginase II